MIDGGQYRWRKGVPAGQVVFVDEAQKAAVLEAIGESARTLLRGAA